MKQLFMIMLVVMTFIIWAPFTQADGGSGYSGLRQTWRAEQAQQKRLDEKFKTLEAEAASSFSSQGHWGQPATAGGRRSRDRK